MTKHLLKLFGILFILITHSAYSQDEFFHEIIIEKKLIENEKWEFLGEANFKYAYDEIGWRRSGVAFTGVRKINRFKVLGGLNNYYTFDKEIEKFFEIRPWIPLQYNFPVFAHVILRQQLKYEWRFFYTEGNNNNRENYGRLRYQLGVDIPLSGKETSSWKIRPSFEWFFIKNPADFERFSNERDFTLFAINEFKNKHTLSFGCTRELYYELNAEPQHGYNFLVGYSF